MSFLNQRCCFSVSAWVGSTASWPQNDPPFSVSGVVPARCASSSAHAVRSVASLSLMLMPSQ